MNDRDRPPQGGGLRFRAANLLLLVPFVGLVTPVFNRTDPVLFGWPFYYWGYLAAVPVGCVLIAVMVRATRDTADAPEGADT